MKKHKWSKIALAFDFAAYEHQYQLRKSTDIPYISHLMSVAALVFENGGNEDQAIAGLLHDVIEDADPASRIPEIRNDIKELFGIRVLEIVEACTDGEPDIKGQKPDWKPRKEAYLSSLESKSNDVLMVSCCDKLHNARSILSDLKTVGVGYKVFNRFSSSKEETLWYYTNLSNLFESKLKGSNGETAARELVDTVAEIKRLAQEIL
ncbi:MAG TPA: HD domain-containing protein [Methylophilaceae bacterium]|nr:HD domain-containing protein [Methylophilaceae bacterium]